MSDPGAQTDGQAQSVESSEALGTDTPDFAGYGMTMSREEYFSRERYVDWCQSLTCASGSGYGRTVLFPDCAAGFNGGGRRGIQKGRIYEVPPKFREIFRLFCPANMFLLSGVGNDLYQVFTRKAPDCETQKIFSSEEPFSLGFCPITACSSAMSLRRFKRRWHGSMRLVWMSRCRSSTIGMC